MVGSKSAYRHVAQLEFTQLVNYISKLRGTEKLWETTVIVETHGTSRCISITRMDTLEGENVGERSSDNK